MVPGLLCCRTAIRLLFFLATVHVHSPFNGVVECATGVRFKKYAVLGDDVVIADAKVASVYKSVLQRLGVAVSLPKSLISNSGCIEFAKKFMVNGVSEDLSPISIRCLSNYYHPNGLMAIRNKYSERITSLVPFAG
ncbi:UNVERIFIED_CONTAM: putative mitochondrial protein [Sesamum radiatum]|uniref:Mitochondrial protein n=1 Tax=Sesamum radiatum TaxID=300843 RepID=A0AAW2IP46_SESRA